VVVTRSMTMTALVSIVEDMAGLRAFLSLPKRCSRFFFGFGFILVHY
jgi:hypothetical protein